MQFRFVVIIAIVSFVLGYIFGQEQILSSKKTTNETNEQKIDYVLKPEENKFQQIVDVKNEVKPIKLSDFEELSKQFYTYLADCEPLNVVSSNEYEMYIIEGINGNNCHFKHRQVGFIDTICNLPMDIAKKYASEGLEEIRQLEELKAQNKTGFVQSSEYITNINNDKNYCRYRQYKHDKPNATKSSK